MEILDLNFTCKEFLFHGSSLITCLKNYYVVLIEYLLYG